MTVYPADIETARSICNIYHPLVKRAVEIASDAPYWKFIPDGGLWAHLSIGDADARLSWPHVTTEYDVSLIEGEHVYFPAALLFLDDAAFAAWKADEKRKYAEKEAARAAQRASEDEQRERMLLAALQQKYEQR